MSPFRTSSSSSLPLIHGFATVLVLFPHVSRAASVISSAISFQCVDSSAISVLLCRTFSSVASLYLAAVSSLFSFFQFISSFLVLPLLHFLASLQFMMSMTCRWSDSPSAPSVVIFLVVPCLCFFFIRNPSNSYHLLHMLLYHVPLLRWLLYVFKCASPCASHQFSKSSPASFVPVLRPNLPLMPSLSAPLPTLS